MGERIKPMLSQDTPSLRRIAENGFVQLSASRVIIGAPYNRFRRQMAVFTTGEFGH